MTTYKTTVETVPVATYAHLVTLRYRHLNYTAPLCNKVGPAAMADGTATEH